MDLESVPWQEIIPNADGDWINQRDERFAEYQAIGDKDKQLAARAIFAVHSSGLKTGRDSWVYNFSKQSLTENVGSMIDFYNEQVASFARHAQTAGLTRPTADAAEAFIDYDPNRFSWNRIDKSNVARGVSYAFDEGREYVGAYRPFTKQHVIFDARLNDMVYQLNRLFPTPNHANVGFYTTGIGSDKPFSVHIMDAVPDLAYWGSSNGQFFSRYTYREPAVEGHLDFDGTGGAYEQIDNITDAALAAYRKAYGDLSITKDDIFYYAYALLHSPEYRDSFAADLKKSLPRIPRVRDFRGFAVAGRRLSELHLGYEAATPYAGIVEDVRGTTSATPAAELYRVTKMKIPKVKGQPDRSRIIYNTRVTLSNIPEEAYRYQLGARSAIEWIIDRYQVKTDAASGIVNDPNDWSDDPRYIIDLLRRIVTVSLETMKVVDALPALDIVE